MSGPKNREEAVGYKYARWAGNRHGNPYKPERCAEEVWPNDRGFIPGQCFRKPGHGPDGIFCKQHAKMKGEGK
jgi:hypothetical protein